MLDHAGDADAVKEDNLKAIAEHVVAEYESGALQTVCPPILFVCYDEAYSVASERTSVVVPRHTFLCMLIQRPRAQ